MPGWRRPAAAGWRQWGCGGWCRGAARRAACCRPAPRPRSPPRQPPPRTRAPGHGHVTLLSSPDTLSVIFHLSPALSAPWSWVTRPARHKGSGPGAACRPPHTPRTWPSRPGIICLASALTIANLCRLKRLNAMKTGSMPGMSVTTPILGVSVSVCCAWWQTIHRTSGSGAMCR